MVYVLYVKELAGGCPRCYLNSSSHPILNFQVGFGWIYLDLLGFCQIHWLFEFIPTFASVAPFA
jgi:hypothetical protein